MNPNDIVTLVGSLGFPIVACSALFWMMNTTMKEFKETVSENTRTMVELISAVNTLNSRGGGNG